MLGERDLSDLIGSIYEAAVEPATWTDVLERVGDAAGHASVAMVTTEDFDTVVDAWLVRHDPACLEARLEGYSRPDTNRALRAFMEQPLLQVVSRREFLTDREYEADPCFQTVLLAQGLYHASIATLYRAGPRLTAFGVYRPWRFGDFEREETDTVARIVPHLARALRIHRHLEAERIDRHRTEEVLDLLSTAICLLAEDGRIIFANRRAEDLLYREDGLTSCAGRLAADHLSDQPRFAAAVAAAVRDRATVVVTLQRSAGLRPLHVWVAPLPRQTDHAFSRMPTSDVLVLAVDPESSAALPAEALKAVYPLTNAEARLTHALLGGERLDDYAARAGITMNTARTHLKAVFAKTDTNRQVDLVRLLSSPLLREQAADRQN